MPARSSRATAKRPIGVGDGITFRADLDDFRQPLDGAATATRGTTPSARYFTLTLYAPSGHLVANSLSRFGFTSQELVRNRTGEFEVTVSPRARPGNWLPTGGVERYILGHALSISLGIATPAAGREAPMPAIISSGTRTIRWVLWIAGGLVLGGIVHRQRHVAAAHRDPGCLRPARKRLAGQRLQAPTPTPADFGHGPRSGLRHGGMPL